MKDIHRVTKSLIGIGAALLMSGLFFLAQAQETQSQQTPNQEQKLQFYEPVGEGLMRFYYDDRYYLSDKYCPFVGIERDAQYDLANNLFHGEFKDYDLKGRLLLQGQYNQGMKEGLFEAFHTNGQLKWSVNYVQDQPDGVWMYYYPDGKPMLELHYGDRGMEIVNYWDLKGVQRVSNREGRYEMKVEVDGYNEYGAVFVNRRGRVQAGKPQGNWALEFVYSDNKTSFVAADTYRDGRLLPDDQGLDEMVRGTDRHNLVPQPWFLRAEHMISKNCSIDEQTGFITYLEHHLDTWFKGAVEHGFEPTRVVYQLEVTNEGSLKKITPVETFATRQEARLLGEAFSAVYFWFPSYGEEDYIDDVLTVSFDVFPDIENKKPRIFSLQIEREKGN